MAAAAANNNYGYINEGIVECGGSDMSHSLSTGSSFILLPFDNGRTCRCRDGGLNMAPLDRSSERWTNNNNDVQYPLNPADHCNVCGEFLLHRSDESQSLYTDVDVAEYDDDISEAGESDKSWLTPSLTIVKSDGNYVVRDPRRIRLDKLNDCIYYTMRDHH